MNCIYCGAELTKEDFCPHCSADVKIYKKIIRASNYYYNEGLAKASVRDLSGAIYSLNKSLHFNKLNTQARNLLGLIYFEMGETVSALSEWVISRNFQSERNDAERYLDAIQKNPAKLETINQTIKKYNQALMYCRQNSQDLAVIQLKKVLSLNPNLIKGHQLLALLYIQAGKYDQAKKYLRAAGKIDSSNTLTLRYLKEVNHMLKGDSTGKKNEKNEDLVSYKNGNETIIQPTHFKESSAVSNIINIAIGVVIGVFITCFLIVPGVKHVAQSEADAAVREANDTISTKEQTINSLQSQIDDLNTKVSDADTASKDNDSKVAAYEQLLNAYVSFTQGDVKTAGDALASLNTQYLSDTAKATYDSINATVNAQYIQTAYNDGYSAYSQQNYTDAVTNLEKVVSMDETFNDGNAVYYLAQSYRNLGQNDKAAEYYQKLIAAYPNTERASNAQRYLDAMGVTTNTTGADTADANTTGADTTGADTTGADTTGADTTGSDTGNADQAAAQ